MRGEESAMSQSAEGEPDADYWIDGEAGGKKLEDEYLLGDIIARGNSSVVYKCLRKGRTEWGCKILKKRQLNKKSVQTHVKALLKLKHPNIVQMKQAFETKDEIQVILELPQGGELFERIVQRGHYSEEDAAHAVRDILKALQYLHSNDIIHRDLKPENLVYQTEMEDSVLKVGDYEMSTLLASPGGSTCASFGYSAPEIILEKELDSSVDMWSLGVITYIMLCGFEPFWDDAGEAAISKKITEGDYSFPSPWWDEVSDSAKELVSQLLRVDPKTRPTAEEALNHPWTLGLSTPKLHMNQTILRLREFNAKRRFRINRGNIKKRFQVATKAVLATCRALNLVKPANADGKTEVSCFCERPTDAGTRDVECSDVRMCCECSLIDGGASDESLPSLPTDGGDVGKNPTKLATKLSAQYKENFVGLG